jgi:transcriptional regulator with XRE-family HTH domain
MSSEKTIFENFLGLSLKTLGERIKYLQRKSGNNQVEFAQSLGVSKGSLILYQSNKRKPDSSLLVTLCELYKVNPTWLLLGEGEPFAKGDTQEGDVIGSGDVMAFDPVTRLLKHEEQQAGVTLTPEQRTAILKIFRELIDKDARAIRELLRSIPGKEPT